ncbi:MAG TPA: hypothetical protein ENO24_01480 [Chloroflexi bacterium]|nr:hypothetical protein [Chloroflexota bacterium]
MALARIGYQLTIDLRKRQEHYQLTIGVAKEPTRRRRTESVIPGQPPSASVNAGVTHIFAAGNRHIAPVR